MSQAAGTQVLTGDCVQVLRSMPADSVDAVVTSPPYAMQRTSTYGGVSAAIYPDWTVTWMAEVKRVLKPLGSVVINIRPNVLSGQISDYVLHSRLALRSSGWVELDEMIWHKPDAPPLGRVDRPRRSWESLLWYATTSSPYCNPKANGSVSQKTGSLTGGRAAANQWSHLHGGQGQAVKEGVARCSDVVTVSVRHNESDDDLTRHPAPYPKELAAWLIRLICPPGGVVLDPFCGSGSTGVAAIASGCEFVGIEIDEQYAAMVRRRLAVQPPVLPFWEAS